MVAIYLVMKGDNEGAGMMRYLLLLMGMFAVYCGLVYNEFFALPINLFQSCYQMDYEDADYTKYVTAGMNPIAYEAPRSVWHPSQSEFGYGTTDYPDYGLRLNDPGVTDPTLVLGAEAKDLW